MQYDDGDWKELRGRVDSLAGAIFIIAGGALTLSITVFLNLKQSGLRLECYVTEAKWAWFLLLGSIVSFVLLKLVLIIQAFMRGFFDSDRYNKTVKFTNTLAWLLMTSGLFSFIYGMFKMVKLAVLILYA